MSESVVLPTVDQTKKIAHNIRTAESDEAAALILGLTIASLYARPPISRDDLETVCEAAERRHEHLVRQLGSAEALHSPHKRVIWQEEELPLRAAIARVREGMK